MPKKGNSLVMEESQKTILSLLNSKNFFLGYLSTDEMAELFIHISIFETTVPYVLDLYALAKRKQNNDLSFETYVENVFSTDLSFINFLKPIFLENDHTTLKRFEDTANEIKHRIFHAVKARRSHEKGAFVKKVLELMTGFFLEEEIKKENSHIHLDLYRTFDEIDFFFNLNYEEDFNQVKEHYTQERLYSGGGVGVQSGYSNILLALHYINPKRNSSVIDLGSGFGRVGLAFSLLRPDLNFTGYEFVAERVMNSQLTTQELSLEDKLNFITQNLADENFIIPEADIYYLYDPFTNDTYKHVVKRINQVCEDRKVTVVTKGHAKDWFNGQENEGNWTLEKELDGGNLSIFQSH